ncbi:NAD(P)-binding protein [Leucogyrophana mollusca]|uniref:NAD(P)-binding protein n=1 Tax=Leucogyrophana mollusca TaxID=85980 RepID=A0ACB8BEI4_9AGAM|nr:NAD(P)-binding protein [Leucogyrophana mollusca]
MSSNQLVWLITGTSSGIGRDLTLAALKRGDKVIATARGRSISKLGDLKAQGADVLELDVTAPLENLQKIAEEAIRFHGRVDVVVNNAGYIHVGAIEESTPQESLDQFNTNVFGALNVSRAFLPAMRHRKSGTVVFIGSIGGWRAVPNAGLYAATKYAIRGVSETLHAEIAPLGLRSICFDFGYFRTSFLTADNRAPYQPRIADYKAMSEQADAALVGENLYLPGDPKKGVEVMIDVIKGEGEAQGKAFPTVLAVGSDCYNGVKGASELTLNRLEEWKGLTISTDFPKM